MSPFSWNPTWEILVRGVSSEQVPLFWCASFHIFSLFTLRAVSFHSQCRDLWKCQGSLSMPSWIRDRKHGQCQWSWRKMSPFTKNQSAGMTAKSQYVSHCSFVLKKEEKNFAFFLQEMELYSIIVLCFKVKGKICGILEVIGLWLCFLQQLQSVGACNRAASSGLWGLLPGLW